MHASVARLASPPSLLPIDSPQRVQEKMIMELCYAQLQFLQCCCN